MCKIFIVFKHPLIISTKIGSFMGVFFEKNIKLFHKELIWKEKREPNRKTDKLSCFSLGPLGAPKGGYIFNFLPLQIQTNNT